MIDIHASMYTKERFFVYARPKIFLILSLLALVASTSSPFAWWCYAAFLVYMAYVFFKKRSKDSTQSLIMLFYLQDNENLNSTTLPYMMARTYGKQHHAQERVFHSQGYTPPSSCRAMTFMVLMPSPYRVTIFEGKDGMTLMRVEPYKN